MRQPGKQTTSECEENIVSIFRALPCGDFVARTALTQVLRPDRILAL